MWYTKVMSGRPWLRRSLAVAGREALAFAKQAWLLRHDAVAPVVPEGATDGDDVVVLLHGLFATAGVMRPIRAAITRHPGVHTAAFTYPPGPGIELLSARLGGILSALPGASRVHLVGHSLGGIVARHFAVAVGDHRIVPTISMASPFAGIRRARPLGFEGARDIDPSSPLLRRVALGEPVAAGATPVPHLSIVAGDDDLVRPPIAHALPGGDVVVLAGRGHNTLLFDPEVAAIIEQRVLRLRAAAAA